MFFYATKKQQLKRRKTFGVRWCVILWRSMVDAIWLEQFDDGHDWNNEEDNEANERDNKGSTTSVAIALKFVTYLIPSCMWITIFSQFWHECCCTITSWCQSHSHLHQWTCILVKMICHNLVFRFVNVYFRKAINCINCASH